MIKSRENELPPTKILQKYTAFLHCWTSMKLAAKRVTKTTIWLSDLLLSNTAHEFRKYLFPRVKSKIQIRKFFPSKPEKSKICEIIPRKISHHTVNCERDCFSCNLSAFLSWLQQSRIRKFRKFFGQESHRPPKSESARTPMKISNCNFCQE